ncbi:MAG: GNAT family N-acetyltransferase [Bryobacteraceae bacterium]
MLKLYEKDEIRRRLLLDAAWSAYALSDLDEGRFEHAHWFGVADDAAVALLYCEFPNAVFIYMGSGRTLQRVLAEVPLQAGTHLQLQAEALSLVRERTPVAVAKPMIRMRLAAPCLVEEDAVPLTAGDAAELLALYADGGEAGESPDFFFPSMLEGGCFFGLRREGMLVAAAGTHIVSRGESAAAIGNVYTHRAHRGRGYAQVVTSAVVGALRKAGIETVILNVAEKNRAAIRVYEKLGFVEHCRFFEAVTG